MPRPCRAPVCCVDVTEADSVPLTHSVSTPHTWSRWDPKLPHVSDPLPRPGSMGLRELKVLPWELAQHLTQCIRANLHYPHLLRWASLGFINERRTVQQQAQTGRLPQQRTAPAQHWEHMGSAGHEARPTGKPSPSRGRRPPARRDRPAPGSPRPFRWASPHLAAEAPTAAPGRAAATTPPAAGRSPGRSRPGRGVPARQVELGAAKPSPRARGGRGGRPAGRLSRAEREDGQNFAPRLRSGARRGEGEWAPRRCRSAPTAGRPPPRCYSGPCACSAGGKGTGAGEAGPGRRGERGCEAGAAGGLRTAHWAALPPPAPPPREALSAPGGAPGLRAARERRGRAWCAVGPSCLGGLRLRAVGMRGRPCAHARSSSHGLGAGV